MRAWMHAELLLRVCHRPARCRSMMVLRTSACSLPHQRQLLSFLFVSRARIATSMLSSTGVVSGFVRQQHSGSACRGWELGNVISSILKTIVSPLGPRLGLQTRML